MFRNHRFLTLRDLLKRVEYKNTRYAMLQVAPAPISIQRLDLSVDIPSAWNSSLFYVKCKFTLYLNFIIMVNFLSILHVLISLPSIFFFVCVFFAFYFMQKIKENLNNCKCIAVNRSLPCPQLTDIRSPVLTCPGLELRHTDQELL